MFWSRKKQTPRRETGSLVNIFSKGRLRLLTHVGEILDELFLVVGFEDLVQLQIALELSSDGGCCFEVLHSSASVTLGGF
jgi:hypothetical protein